MLIVFLTWLGLFILAGHRRADDIGTAELAFAEYTHAHILLRSLILPTVSSCYLVSFHSIPQDIPLHQDKSGAEKSANLEDLNLSLTSVGQSCQIQNGDIKKDLFGVRFLAHSLQPSEQWVEDFPRLVTPWMALDPTGPLKDQVMTRGRGFFSAPPPNL